MKLPIRVLPECEERILYNKQKVVVTFELVVYPIEEYDYDSSSLVYCWNCLRSNERNSEYLERVLDVRIKKVCKPNGWQYFETNRIYYLVHERLATKLVGTFCEKCWYSFYRDQIAKTTWYPKSPR